MRTTVVLDDEVYEAVRRRAFEQRRPLGAILSELTRRGLQVEAASQARRPWGRYAGQIEIAAGFDDTPPEVLEAMARPIGTA